MTVAPWGNAPPRWHRTALWGRGSYRGVVRLQAELDFEWDQCMFDPALWIYAPLGYERLECTRIFANDPITGLQYTTCTEWAARSPRTTALPCSALPLIWRAL